MRGRARSVASVATSRTASSRGVSASSGRMSIEVGEFQEEESAQSLEAARGAKEVVSGTAKMGISLVPKNVSLTVTGKVKREPKPVYTNSHLPFPGDSQTADLKVWQNTFLPELLDWVATLDDAFAANSDPVFKIVAEDIWEQHFGAYVINDAIFGMGAAGVRNWRSRMGKIALAAVAEALKNMSAEEAIKEVARVLEKGRFLYEDSKSTPPTGAYRSPIVLQVFASHLQYTARVDPSCGNPVGALALACSAVERAYTLHKSGHIKPVERRGSKRTAQSFLANPWAARARAYLPQIKALSDQKWLKIAAGAHPYIDAAALVTADTEDEEEAEGDYRSMIVVSDDEDDDEAEMLAGLSAPRPLSPAL
ncbi:hypothetical protein FB45DRAFT_1072146 [Roridomyces roridus]|uniref:DUF6532 domain-containing protein n=1 Tax=Roridomyces roridus TaxID=1738132 RepID=A0AAD7AXC1_9AGAR|nr:hypothetical protein FB45DRAFT_1072146 [Roridomyces roridus]